jgi:hypothetical protein
MNVTEPPQESPKQIVRATRILFGALVVGVLLFMLVTIIVNQLNGPLFEKNYLAYNDIFLAVAFVLGVACIFGARFFYGKAISSTNSLSFSLDARLNQYRGSLIIYMAFCEAAALFSIVIFFLTGNYIVLTVTGIMLVAMFMKAPTKRRIISELALDLQQQKEIK